MHSHGVEVLVGTDAGNPYVFSGFSVHDELELLVEAGLSPRAAFKAGTRGGASLTAGATANLVVLDGNPLATSANTQRIHTVLTRGRVARAGGTARRCSRTWRRLLRSQFPLCGGCAAEYCLLDPARGPGIPWGET